MKLQRYVRRLGRHEVYEKPRGWYVTTRDEKPGRPVNCAGCGERVEFRHTVPSDTIKDERGEGYAICRKCMYWEMEEEQPWA